MSLTFFEYFQSNFNLNQELNYIKLKSFCIIIIKISKIDMENISAGHIESFIIDNEKLYK